MTELSTYPYPPRPGTNLEGLDFDDFSHGLGERLDEVIEFEHQLFNVQLDTLRYPTADAYRLQKEAEGSTILPLETVWSMRVNSTDFSVDYFMTHASEPIGAKVPGLGSNFPDESCCLRAIASLDISGVDSKVLNQVEAESVGYEETTLAGMFTENGFIGDDLPAPNLVTVFKNPGTILEKARGYKNIKSYISRAIKDLGDPEKMDEADKAKLLIAQLYRNRINVLLKDVYVDAYKLAFQSRSSGNNLYGDLLAQLETVLPALFSRRDQEDTANFLQRMDRFTNGVSRDANNRFTWLSPEAMQLAESEDSEVPSSHTIDRGIYSDIEPEKLVSTDIDGETFGDWVKLVLAEYGLLSEHVDWESDRTTAAPDGKWQVIVDDKFKSLSVYDKQRVVKVPTKTVSVLKAVSVINHEITHVIQNENKRAIGNLAILEKVGVDNVTVQTESGGLWQERVASEILTGVSEVDVSGTGYYAALLAKSEGGSFGECVQAYFEELKRRDPNTPTDKLVIQAVNRSRRVYRSGGLQFAENSRTLTNTQPLNYLEQRLVYEALGDEQRKLLFVGGVAMANLVRMNQTGLIDTSKISIPKKMPYEILLPEVKAVLALSA